MYDIDLKTILIFFFPQVIAILTILGFAVYGFYNFLMFVGVI